MRKAICARISRLSAKLVFGGSCLGLAVALVAIPLGAQTDLSTIRGTARDATGAVVPNAQITLLDTLTRSERSTATDGQGNFEMPYLPRGTYQLRATSEGFQTFVADSIILESSQIRRIDVSFELGQVTEQVTVESAAAVIDTEGAKLTSGLDQVRYDETPHTLSYLAVWWIVSALENVQSRKGSIGYQIAGQDTLQSEFSVDGIPNGGRGVVITTAISTEDLQELTMTSVNNNAEFSRVGTYNAVTKSGTNAVHGRLSYLHQNDALNARPATASVKPSDKAHTFSASVGGPIARDRTFFYVGYSGQIFPQEADRTNDTPSLKMREGDFSQLAQPIRDPLTGNTLSARSPFPDNTIPVSRISETSRKFTDQFIPRPNFGGLDLLSGNLRWIHPYPTDIWDAKIADGRIDHKIGDSNSLSGKLTFARWDYNLPGRWPDASWRRLRHQWAGMLSNTHIFNPQVINEFRWGVHAESWDDDYAFVGREVTDFLGLPAPSSRLNADQPGQPVIAITGFQTFEPVGTLSHWEYRPMVFSDSVTWASGRHIVKFGGTYRHFYNLNPSIDTSAFGRYAFNGSITGNPFADFLVGIPFSSTRIDPLIDREKDSYEVGLFLQDTFKVTPAVTLDYGLRWEVFPPASFRDNLQYRWDLATGQIVIPDGTQGLVDPRYPSNIRVSTGQVLHNAAKRNFRPRFGLAYRLKDDLVLRGGYGIYSEYRGYDKYSVTGGPFGLSETFFQEFSAGQPLFQFPQPFPTGSGLPPSQSAQGYPLDLPNGYIQQFNVSLEKQIGDVGFRASYIGSKGTRFNYLMNINKPPESLIPFTAARRPYPEFVNVLYDFQGGNQKYNAFQFAVKRKMSNLIMNLHWTWASNYSDMLNLQDPYNHRHYNRDAFTPRHSATGTVAWQVPVGRGRTFGANLPRVGNAVLGEWTINWLGYFQTGSFFSPSFAGSDPSNTNTFGGVPDRIGNGNLPPSERKLTRWFDSSAFVVPSVGRYGNSGVNVLEGPGVNAQHVNITKRFGLGERLDLSFGFAATNIFNHPNYSDPRSNISVPSQVGTIVDLRAGYGGGAERGARRIMEMRIRIEF